MWLFLVGSGGCALLWPLLRDCASLLVASCTVALTNHLPPPRARGSLGTSQAQELKLEVQTMLCLESTRRYLERCSSLSNFPTIALTGLTMACKPPSPDTVASAQASSDAKATPMSITSSGSNGDVWLLAGTLPNFDLCTPSAPTTCIK